MRKQIGRAMIVTPFIAMAVGSVLAFGLLQTLTIFVVIAAVFVWLVVAVELLA